MKTIEERLLEVLNGDKRCICESQVAEQFYVEIRDGKPFIWSWDKEEWYPCNMLRDNFQIMDYDEDKGEWRPLSSEELGFNVDYLEFERHQLEDRSDEKVSWIEVGFPCVAQDGMEGNMCPISKEDAKKMSHEQEWYFGITKELKWGKYNGEDVLVFRTFRPVFM